MKIGILGSGAMGSLVGYFLQKGGEDVWLIDPYKEHMEAIRQKGLHVLLHRRDIGVKTEEVIEMKTTTDGNEVGKCDLVIVLTKSPYTTAAIKGATALFGEDTFVLTLQNGLGNEDKLLEFFPPERVGCGVLEIQSTLIAPGEIHSAVTESIGVRFRCIAGVAPASLLKLEECLNKTEAKALYTDETNRMIWRKALVNLPTSFVTGLIGVPAMIINEHQSGRNLFEGIIREAVEVANSTGMDFDADEEVENFITATAPRLLKFSSAARDMFNNRITEIESLNGAIGQIGRKTGIATPINDTIANMVRVIQSTYDKQAEIDRNA